MRFTVAVVALFAIFHAVAAHGGFGSEIKSLDFESKPGDLNKLINISSSFLSILKAALKSKTVFDCTIKEVIEIKNACLHFLGNAKSFCDPENKIVQAVIDSVHAVLQAYNNIIHLNTNLCGNGKTVGNDNYLLSGKVGLRCFMKILKEITILKNHIASTIQLIKTLPAMHDNCYKICTDLATTFEAFPKNIKYCFNKH